MDNGFNCGDELKDWISSEKWWPNWIGFILSIVAAVISIKYDSSIIGFSSWESNMNRSIIGYQAIIGILCLFPILFCSFALCDIATNPSLTKKELLKKISTHFRGFLVFYIMSIICFIIGSQTNMKQYGMGYAILSLLIGMLMINISSICCKNFQCLPSIISGATSKGEFYIKCGLVLLATDLKKVVRVGAPGLIISWIIPPLIIIIMWYFAKIILKLKPTNDAIILALSSGTAICGVSAICAVGAVVKLNTNQTAMAVSILSFFTIIYMIIVPYIALYTNMNSFVAGAWIGGSVDGTGNVVASVGILDDDDAYETATLIKMAQNILIGAVCLVIALKFDQKETKHVKVKSDTDINTAKFTFQSVPVDDPIDTDDNEDEGQQDDECNADGNINHDTKSKPKSMNKCYFLWKKFPKFIIGFIVLSIIISGFIQPFASETYTKNFMSIIKQLSKWLFCFGFLGIGSNTIFVTLFKQIKDGKLLALYLFGQTLDTLITLLFSWIIVTFLM